MTNWKEIHSDFTPELQKEWEDRGFSYEETKKWIDFLDKNFDVNDYSFCAWMRDKKILTVGEEFDIDELIKKYNQSFEDNNFSEDFDFSSEEEAESFSKEDSSEKSENESVLINNVTCDQCKKKVENRKLTWFSDTEKDLDFCSEDCYSIWNNKFNVQEYLVWKYPNKKERGKVTRLDISNKGLGGELDLSEFVNLRELYCSSNKLNFLNVGNCSWLKVINCFVNKLTSLDLGNCSRLTEIVCSDNLLVNITLPNIKTNLEELDLSDNDFLAQDLSFLSEFIDLEELDLGNYDEEKINQGIYNRFTGSLDYLSEMKNLRKLGISNTDINEADLSKLPNNLEEIDYSTEKKPNSRLIEIIPKLEEYEWKDLHSDFTLESRRGWEKEGFSKEETGEWAITEEEVWDYKIASYLREVKKVTFQEFIDYKKKEEFECQTVDEYNWCRKCQKPNTSEDWCQFCSEKEWQKDLKQLSGKELVEKFIQKQQAINEENQLFWIPYEEFSNIEYLTEGGFSKIYKAEWQTNRNQAEDEELQKVVLKILNDSQNITLEFLSEIANNKLVDNNLEIVSCHGISQDPITKNYLMVIDYMENGSLRQFLKKRQVDWEEKLNKLETIARGLDSIHQQGLVHRDLHPGNVLSSEAKFIKDNYYKDSYYDNLSCHISDLGLSKPVNFQLEKGIILGVLPYVAPEVLTGKPYTKTADIYSFGMIAYEVLTELPPYYDIPHNNKLGSSICQGLRPIFNIKIPTLLKELIKKCWDANPIYRPSADELEENLGKWRKEIYEKKITKFSKQLQEVKNHNHALSENSKFFEYQIHSQAIYTSRLLDFQNLPRPQNNLSQEWQTSTLLELQIRELEREIEEIKKPQVAELVENFVKFKIRLIKDNENKKLENEVWELEEKLEEKGIVTENIEKIIRYCEKLVSLKENSTGLTKALKRQLSFSEPHKKTKEVNLSKKKKIQKESSYYQPEPMEIDNESITKWTNINPNFIPELIQAWANHNFTPEQCRDWINTVSPNKRDRVIKEPDYYAWLRDVKQVDSYWVLNEGNEQILNQEFFQWRQQQIQSKIEISPK